MGDWDDVLSSRNKSGRLYIECARFLNKASKFQTRLSAAAPAYTAEAPRSSSMRRS
jgi:hypothetical protein